jgi:hypothetical protein
MSEGRVELLFDEFATRYRRGERPDVLEYLERAGEEREALAGLVDRFLEAVPARAPSEEEVVRMQALVQRDPPLLVLRLRRRLTREAVVSSLVKALGLDPAKSEKVGGYYHRLEVGILDPEGVDRSVWDVLADLFAANARALAPSAPEPPAASAVAFMREPSAVLEESVEIPAAAAPAAEEPDEVDRLFTAGA